MKRKQIATVGIHCVCIISFILALLGARMSEWEILTWIAVVAILNQIIALYTR